MGQGLPLQRDPQLGQPDPIALQHLTGPVNLIQHGHTILMQGAPLHHVPLKGAQLPLLVLAGVCFTQSLK
jgi:hypothetical protein